MRTAILATMAFMLMPIAATAQQPAAPAAAGAPEMNPVSNAVRKILERQSKNIVAAAEEMPADKFGYKPTPTQMTFAALVEHTTGTNNFLCAQISGTSSPAGGEIERERSEREACERAQGVIRLLHASSGQSRRFETWRVHPILWRASGVARGGNDHSRYRFCRPLRHGGDVLAVEWTGAADGETKGMRLLFL